MGLYQSYRQVFVTNSPSLLADGQTVDALAVGQIGILDAKTNKAIGSPTYAKTKAIKAVWGTPNINLGDFGGAPNENEYSKLIKGKQIISFRANRAKRGVTPLYTIGWSGDNADTDTLFTTAGESRDLFIKITGDSIDRLYSKQGLTKLFKVVPNSLSDCDDKCAPIDCSTYVKQLVAQINNDKDFSKFLRASVIQKCTTNEVINETQCYKFRLDVCDTGDAYALGLVQAQYPNDIVTLTNRVSAISSYSIVRFVNTLPTAYSSSTISVPDCPTCPAGATLTASANVFEFSVTHGSAAPAPVGIVSTVLLNANPEYDTYKVYVAKTSDPNAVIAAADAAGQVAVLMGVSRDICTLTPSTFAWVADGTMNKRDHKIRITIADSVCGTNRLADIQARYPNLTISVVDSSGSCVHTYETTIQSNCYNVGCSTSEITYTYPSPFEGVKWVDSPIAVTSTGCQCGILIETAFVNRKTTDCSFDAFPYENDIVHVQISNYDPDYNGDPAFKPWVVKQIRQVQYPAGHGMDVQRLELDSKMYDQRFRHHEAAVREFQGYSLQANPSIYYDEYVLNFRTIWKTGSGWAEDYTATWELTFFVPEGNGAALEKTLGGYFTSAGIEEDFKSII